ncbi:MAG: hypothetical protein AAGU19_08810 [Prolixibacteraceae bacterium]
MDIINNTTSRTDRELIRLKSNEDKDEVFDFRSLLDLLEFKDNPEARIKLRQYYSVFNDLFQPMYLKPLDILIEAIPDDHVYRSESLVVATLLYNGRQIKKGHSVKNYSVEVVKNKYWSVKKFEFYGTFGFGMFEKFGDKQTFFERCQEAGINPEYNLTFEEYLSEIEKKNGKPICLTIFDQKQLRTIYTRSAAAKVIKCTEDDFLYWFSGKGETGTKISWIKTKGESKNLTALFYYCKKLNPEIKPGVINNIFGTSVTSHNDNTRRREYIPKFPEIDQIFNGL